MPNRIALATLAMLVAAFGATALSSCARPAQEAAAANMAGWCAPSAAPIAGEVQVSFRRDVVPMLRSHCASCHAPGGAGAEALMMFDAGGAPQHAAIRAHAGRMLLELQTGRMPQGRPYSVPPAQFRQLDVWSASGLPDN